MHSIRFNAFFIHTIIGKHEMRGIIIGICYASVSTYGDQTGVDTVVFSPLHLYSGAAAYLKQLRAVPKSLMDVAKEKGLFFGDIHETAVTVYDVH